MTTSSSPGDPDAIALVLVAAADPQARQGLPEREASYRLRLALKVLLRQFGLRCVFVGSTLPSRPGPPAERNEFLKFIASGSLD